MHRSPLSRSGRDRSRRPAARTRLSDALPGLMTTRGPDGATRRRRAAVSRMTAVGAVPVLALAAGVAALVPAIGSSGDGGSGDGAAAGVQVETMPVVDGQTVFTLHGHGHGHGRGMGQWGAYGYATQQGWSAEQILAHYYPDTELEQSAPDTISVRLMGRDGKDVAVHAGAPMTAGGHEIPAGQAVTLHPTQAGADVTVTEGCGGAVVDSFSTGDPVVHPVDPGVNRPANEQLRLCDGDAPYRGTIAVALDGGDARTVNTAAMDDYLRGVVPVESSPGWADTGGFEALRAQAVAARSYAAAEHNYDYADTCDTQACQVYKGTAAEDARTDRAIAETAGTVVTRGGEVMATEFSASTGGYTAGGDFGAVEDAGDAVSPTHDWTQTVTAQQVSDAFEVGPLESMAVTERNGQGADGGRVKTLHVVGADRTVDVSGDEARTELGLKSDWFTIEGQDGPGGPASSLPPDSIDPGVLDPAAPEPGPGTLPESADAVGDTADMAGGAGISGEDVRSAADALSGVPEAVGADSDLGGAIGAVGAAAARGLDAYGDTQAAGETP